MTTTTHRPPRSRDRKLTIAAGLFYLATFVFSIPALALYEGVLEDPGYVLGAGSADGVLWGGLIEVLTALAGIGTAVAVYPILKRHSSSRAVGFVASRTLEAALIFTGVLAVLAVYTLRQDSGGGRPRHPHDDRQRAGRRQGLVLPPRPGCDAGHQRPVLRDGAAPHPPRAPHDHGPRLHRGSGAAGLQPCHPLRRLRAGVRGGHADGAAHRQLGALSVGLYMLVKGFRTPPVATEPVEPLADEGRELVGAGA